MKQKMYWIFTFGFSREVYGERANTATKVYADSYGEARDKMVANHGTKWAFQYSAEEWEGIRNRPDRFWNMEEITEVIE